MAIPPRWDGPASEIPKAVIELAVPVTVGLYADGASHAELRGLIVARRDITGHVHFRPDGALEWLGLEDGITGRELPERVIRAAENAARRHVTAARRELAVITRAQRRRREG